MKPVFLVFTFLVTLFNSPMAKAQLFGDDRKFVIDFVHSTCQNPSQAFLPLFATATAGHYEATSRVFVGDLSGIRGMLERKNVHAEIERILFSEHMQTAMRDCYGNDDGKKNRYAMTLIAANSLAYLVGVGGVIVGFPKALQLLHMATIRILESAAVYGRMIQNGLMNREILRTIVNRSYAIATTGVPVTLVGNQIFDDRSEMLAYYRPIIERDMRKLAEYESELTKLTKSAADQAYRRELVPEMIEVIGVILGNPAITSTESKMYKEKREGLRK